MSPDDVDRKILEYLYKEHKVDPRHMVKTTTLFSKIAVDDDVLFQKILNSLLNEGYITCIREPSKSAPILCNAKITKKGIHFITPKK
jgi:hypothetical protein